MSALTDFLLARIAEDEAWARHRDIVTFGSADPGPDHPTRVLARCKADRRIIEWLPERTVLCLLALPYADHPDYREATR